MDADLPLHTSTLSRPAPPATQCPTLKLLLLGLLLQAVLVANLLRGHKSFADSLSVSDGSHYSFVAQLAVTGVRHPEMPEWAERMFIGWPLTFALFGKLFDFDAMCVLLASVFATLMPVAFWQLTRDWTASLAAALISPTWLMQSSMGMGEPAFLVYQLIAISACLRGRYAVGSLAASAALAVRPNAAFVWLALALIMWRRRAWTGLRYHTAFAAATVLAVVAFNIHFYGDPLRQVHLYKTLPNAAPEAVEALRQFLPQTGHLGLPFVNVLATPFILKVPLWKTAYIWLHALAICLVSWVGLRELRSQKRASASSMTPSADARGRELHTIMTVWAVLNTLFVVCTGPYWGFFTFDRYCLWALPAYLYIARNFLPQRSLVWAVIGSSSLALALYNQTRYFSLHG